MKRYDIINALIKKNRYKSYLELGVSNKKENFDKINCADKYGVDIDFNAEADFTGSTDAFFKNSKKLFDIIFVDALHEKDQVVEDVMNSILFLKDGGTIVCHDCNPTNELMQRVPRETKEWCGDPWKAIVTLRRHKNMNIHTVDTDYGCAIIQLKESKPIKVTEELTYANLKKNRREWLGLISVEQFKQMYL